MATRALQATNSSQAGRLTPRAFLQASQEDSAIPLSAISQTGNPQALLADSTLSPAKSALSQVGSAWSSQAGSSQSSPEDSPLSQSNISQTGSSQASLIDNTPSLTESEISQVGSTQSSQAGSSESSPEESTLEAGSAILPQAVRCSARLRASQASHIPPASNPSKQAGPTPRVDSVASQLDSTVPQVASS